MTFLRSPTPVARFFISPRPLYTLVSCSEMVLKLSLKRFSTEACSFSSTVSRISSSFLALSVWRSFTLESTVFWMVCRLVAISLRLSLKPSSTPFVILSTVVSTRIMRSWRFLEASTIWSVFLVMTSSNLRRSVWVLFARFLMVIKRMTTRRIKIAMPRMAKIFWSINVKPPKW